MMEAIWLASVILAFALPAWLVLAILGLLDRAAKDRKRPIQFTLGDFLCLFLLLQLATAAPYWLNVRDSETTWEIYLIGWIVIGLLWCITVRTLSLAGIRKTWHRAVLLMVVIPGTIFAALAVPVLGIVTFGIVAKNGDRLSEVPVLVEIACAQLVLLAAMLAFRALTRKIMTTAAEAAARPAPGPSDDQ